MTQQTTYLGKLKLANNQVAELGDRGKTVVIPLSSESTADFLPYFLYSSDPSDDTALTTDELALDTTTSNS